MYNVCTHVITVYLIAVEMKMCLKMLQFQHTEHKIATCSHTPSKHGFANQKRSIKSCSSSRFLKGTYKNTGSCVHWNVCSHVMTVYPMQGRCLTSNMYKAGPCDSYMQC